MRRSVPLAMRVWFILMSCQRACELGRVSSVFISQDMGQKSRRGGDDDDDDDNYFKDTDP